MINEKPVPQRWVWEKRLKQHKAYIQALEGNYTELAQMVRLALGNLEKSGMNSRGLGQNSNEVKLAIKEFTFQDLSSNSCETIKS